MSKTLVIVESPTKAKTISKFLGAAYTVESSLGHLRDLPKSKMGIDIEGGTFEPTYVIPTDKKKHVTKLKKLAKTAKTVIFATDEDREGEAISWHLAQILDIDASKAERIAFHEITKHAIGEAMKHPRKINQPLVDAQQARRVLDRLVGYELSPLLWKKVARGLSAGRVQSVAVRLCVEREREIKAFVSEEYWTLDALLNKDKHDFAARLHSKDGKKLDKFAIATKEAMDEVLAEVKGKEFKIEKIEKKETKRNPPPPYRTSTLQQNANQKFGYSSRQTMRLAQQLYEGIKIGSKGQVGLITYMRTDSTNLSTKFINETREFAMSEYGDKYALKEPRTYKSKAKGAQEAHEAIRPTDPTITPESIEAFLDPQQYKIYSLIWRRAVATQLAAARLNKTSINITTQNYMFRATGQSMIFDGWLKLYPESVKEEMLPELTEGETIYCKELKPEQHFTQPPARYSDATLVKALEEHGIGRPSTYAPTIATIENRNYVERTEDKRLKPQDIAFVVTDMLMEHFPDIVSYEFTATMEDNLDDIADGKKDWKPIISTFYHPFHKLIEDKEVTIDKQEVLHKREIGTDPKTGKPISARIGRFGPFVQLGDKDDEEKPRFASLPKGKLIEEITIEEALHLLSLPRVVGQDAEGNDMTIAIGRFGPYVKVKSKYYSLKDKDPYTITHEEALEVVRLKKEEDAKKVIHDFKEAGIQVLNGRYGPYITDGNKNAKIPKETDPEKLTLEECKKMIEEAPEKRRRGKKAAATKKKPGAKKKAPAKKKKGTAKKKATTKKKKEE